VRRRPARWDLVVTERLLDPGLPPGIRARILPNEHVRERLVDFLRLRRIRLGIHTKRVLPRHSIE
jgi:hypothetical protein